MIAAGIVLTFWGNQFLNFVIHFVVAVTVILVGGTMIFWAFDSTTAEWIKIVAFVAVFLLANFIGFMVSRMRAIGIAIIAGVAGCTLGFTITTAL